LIYFDNENYSERRGERPEPPPGGTNVQKWYQAYYADYTIQFGYNHFIPPPPSTSCTADGLESPGWLLMDFDFWDGASAPGLWVIVARWTRIGFNIVNLANGYEVHCGGDYVDLAIFGDDKVENWHGCYLIEEVPLVPPTYFRFNRQTHQLEFNQSWTCEVQGQR
jgi:hypothetical protein